MTGKTSRFRSRCGRAKVDCTKRRAASFWRRFVLFTGLLALTHPALGHAPGELGECARPALWVVSDADTTIFLFGTFHAHDGRAQWFDHAVKTAFDRSDELVLETLVPTDPNDLADALNRHRLRAAAGGESPGGGLAGARQAMTSARSAGLSFSKGADSVLRQAAESSGKAVGGLETFEFQLGMYDRLPAAQPLQAAPAPSPAPSRLAAADPTATLMKQMMSAWNRGDAGTFEAVVGAVQAQSPAAYRILFAERNSAWAWWIARRLQAPGTAFVAVGTGHLVGRDSVQAKLASLGIHSARVN